MARSARSGRNVNTYLVAKGQQYSQTSTATAQLAAMDPYVFVAQVLEPYGRSTLNSATIQPPDGSTDTLAAAADVYGLEYLADFASKSQFDSAFAKGTYRFSIVTAHDGTKSLSLSLPADAYPNAPHVTDWTAAQSVNPGANFLLTWDALQSGTASDFIKLTITDSSGNEVFYSPDAGEAGT